MSPAAFADTRRPKSTRATEPLHREATIGLLYLTRWPALPAQLTERDRLVHRICTLLSSKPRASHLIPPLVQAPKDDVQAALRALLQTGCIHIGRSATESCSASRPQAVREPAPAATPDAAAASAHPSATAAPVSSVSSVSPVSAASPTLPASPATRLGKLWSRLSA
ncbi:hypothetical protein N5C43_07480 [Comamonas terrigena]|uniref:hypothetical protein n=1 Tax=Comamonas terrigena TaxID=32013 RepID=UPI0024473581|nr:hypothetical protein [Comamonas terrigena]MDH1291099.1 hypothetical protein [Comamonas terrigena]